MVDTRLGVITWLVTAAHEIPQEFGDFGILVHSGWEPYRALGYNLLSALLYDEIARRRDAHDVAERTDILSVLLRGRDENGRGLGDAELRDALMTLLVAGHETTATVLSWIVERLVRTPAVLKRLSGAVAGGDGSYLEAVIKETLRTRPVVPDMPRVLTEPLDLDGYRVPAGWWVSPAAPLLHGAATPLSRAG